MGSLFVSNIAMVKTEFSATSSTDAHTALRARSRAVIDVHSLPRGKERTKKTRQRLPPLETALPAVSEMNGGDFCDSKGPPSAGHISHPADGLTIGKILWAINDRPYEVKLTF